MSGLRDKIHAYRPQKPPRLPMSQAERELVAAKIQVRQAWEASGRMFAKNPDGSWRYTTADLTAEARAILAQRA